jgi:hypothetical protein
VIVDDKGGLANVVVFLEPAPGQHLDFKVPDSPAILTEKELEFSPHVLAVVVGRALEIRNEDNAPDEVRSTWARNLPFDYPLPPHGVHRIPALRDAELLSVKSIAHYYMGAFIYVLDNPYFAVTREDGSFTIDTRGLPDGEYNFKAWQEAYSYLPPQKVVIKDGKSATPLRFVFDADRWGRRTRRATTVPSPTTTPSK